MDIIPNKKSDLLYQKRDQKVKGIIDLRRFSDENGDRKRIIENKDKIVFDVVRKEKKELNAVCFEDNYENIFSNKQDNLLDRQEPKEIKESKLKFPGFRFSLIFQNLVCFVLVSFLASSVILSLSFIQKGIEQKGRVLGASIKAYDYLKLAGQSAYDSDFEQSVDNFNSATINFSNAKKSIDKFGFGIAEILEKFPLSTPFSTASNLTEVGKNISLAGKNLAEVSSKLSLSGKNNAAKNLILDMETDISNIALYLRKAQESAEKIDENHLPENMKEKIKTARNELLVIANNFQNLSDDFPAIAEMLGKNRPQKYLLLFQNNSEIRATGGFIGSYGILDIENGQIKNLFIDGAFNPDGQLSEKIVPPRPIQKISANWSMHDSNWFADFPTSAKKAALFYEKTGGPTVDGVIAITPNVIEKLLKITGPIEMPKYDITIDEKNFLTQTQMQVEELYDKEENRPKQIIADLAPKVIEKLADTKNLSADEKTKRYLSLMDIIQESFQEKHILIYHRNSDIENMAIRRGWGGQMLNSSGDYLSVIHSNINGYKTDAVIEERVIHNSKILSDGSIIDTVKIIRKHNGGKSDYDWYNRVNSDYMRVYVPLGSVLLEAKGHTRQDYEPPIDYSRFKIDPDVKKIETSIKIDPDSGTYIFEETGKTVFGNWVYVSPGEKVEVEYKYKLPYKIDFDNFTKPADKYSMLVQKQSGSVGSIFSGSIQLPKEWKMIWNSKNLDAKNLNESVIETDLKTDKIYGTVFIQNYEK